MPHQWKPLHLTYNGNRNTFFIEHHQSSSSIVPISRKNRLGFIFLFLFSSLFVQCNPLFRFFELSHSQKRQKIYISERVCDTHSSSALCWGDGKLRRQHRRRQNGSSSVCSFWTDYTQEVLLVHSNNNRLEWPTQDPVMLYNVKKAPHV